VLAGFYDITERKRLEKEILEISGREQRRIGQDLHDDLCQNLAGIAVMLSAFEKNLGDIDPELASRASSISQYINDTIVRTKSLARGLYPAALDESGLAYMLQELSNNIQGQFGIECVLSVEEKVVPDDSSVALNLYRIAQEATNNAIRHGNPSLIEIDYISNEDEVVLSVHDNGKGFPKNAEPPKGMGLRIMNYRANMIGAKLDIRQGASTGVTLMCILKRKS
jgi:signal transduction histidine kinase